MLLMLLHTPSSQSPSSNPPPLKRNAAVRTHGPPSLLSQRELITSCILSGSPCDSTLPGTFNSRSHFFQPSAPIQHLSPPPPSNARPTLWAPMSSGMQGLLLTGLPLSSTSSTLSLLPCANELKKQLPPQLKWRLSCVPGSLLLFNHCSPSSF